MLFIGVLLGVLITLVMGQSLDGAGKADFGIAVQNDGFAIVEGYDGTLYVVTPQSGRAEIVENRDGPYRGGALNLNQRIRRERERD